MEGLMVNWNELESVLESSSLVEMREGEREREMRGERWVVYG
jgi:hypothetical protein